MDPEVARKNVLWGLALLGVVVVLTVGSVAIAVLYGALS